MKRYLSLFLALILSLSLFCACGPAENPQGSEQSATGSSDVVQTSDKTDSDPTDSTDSPDEEVAESSYDKIREDYVAQYGIPLDDPAQITLCEYGTNSAYKVLMISCPWEDYAAVDTTEQVGNYEFEYPSSNTLKVYKSGTFGSLSDAYGQGIVTDTDLAELHRFYSTGVCFLSPGEAEPKENQQMGQSFYTVGVTNEFWTESPAGPLTPELEEEILCAKTKDSVLSKDDYDLVYYGGAHGVYAVHFDYLGPTTDEYRYYDVPRGQEMNYVPISLYRDGEICSLREGLQKGWITEQEAKLFYRNYRCLYLDRNSGNQPDEKSKFQTLWEAYYGDSFYYRDLLNYGSWRGDLKHGTLSVYCVWHSSQSSATQTIGGVTFTGDLPFELHVFNGEKFCTLEQAVRRGLFLKDELEILAYFHQRLPEAGGLDLFADGFSWKTLATAESLLANKSLYTEYYGTYQGNLVFYALTENSRVADLTAGDTVIRAVNDLYVYRDGKVEPMSKAYADGRLTQKHLQSIAAKHRTRQGKYYRGSGSMEPIDDKVAVALENAWLKEYNRKRLFAHEHYFGSFEGYEFVLAPWGGSSHGWVEAIGSCDFRCEDRFTIYGYKDGKLTDLVTLYQDGKVSENTLKALEQIQRKYFAPYYEYEKPQDPAWTQAAQTAAQVQGWKTENLIYYGSFGGVEVVCVPDPNGEYGYYSIGNSNVSFTRYGVSLRCALFGLREGEWILLIDDNFPQLSMENRDEIMEYHRLRYLFVVMESGEAYSGSLPKLP